MTIYSNIRDEIVTILGTVPNIGRVHNRVRFVADESQYLALFKTTSGSEIRAWWVTWGGIPETNIDGSVFGAPADRYRFVVRGILALKDSTDTESTFISLATEVLYALRAEKNFSQSEVMVFSVDVTAGEPEHRQFGSVLCHFIEISVECVVAKEIVYG